MTQAQNVAIESSQINSSGVLLTTGGGTGLATVGTNGQVLTSNGTTLSWVTPSASSLTGTLPVANGGTGLTSITSGYILYGNGTGAINANANLYYNGTGLYTTATSNQAVLGIYNTAVAPAAGFSALRLGSSSGTDKWQVQYNNADASLNFYDFTAAATRLSINSSGYVGIGTTSPATPLFVWSTSSANSSIVSASDDGSGNSLGVIATYATGSPNSNPRAVLGLAGYVGYVKLYDGGNTLQTVISGTGTSYMQSSALVIGGTAANGYKLNVAGNAYTNQSVVSGNNVIINSTNLNSLKTAGSYTGYSFTNAPSAASTAWCFVEVFTNGSDQVFQRLTPAQYQSNSVWNRMSTDGGTTWNTWTKESGTGSVIQIVQTVSNTQVGYTGTSFQTVSSLSTSITPSSTSSKILVMITSSWGIQDNSYAFMKLQRGGSDITGAKGSATGTQVAVSQELLLALNGTTVQQHVYTSTYIYLDSPASSTSTTYSIVVNAQQVNSQTIYLNRGYSITGDTNNAATISTMTLMEIAG
jgi:hypothetical protein